MIETSFQPTITTPPDNEDSMASITPDSRERLYVINDLRDQLVLRSEELRSLGVTRVIAFGSSIKGTAKNTSDIDVVFAFGNDHDSFATNRPALKELLDKIPNFPSTFEFRPPKKEDSKVVHITFEDTELPSFARDGIEIWPKNMVSAKPSFKFRVQ